MSPVSSINAPSFVHPSPTDASPSLSTLPIPSGNWTSSITFGGPTLETSSHPCPLGLTSFAARFLVAPSGTLSNCTSTLAPLELILVILPVSPAMLLTSSPTSGRTFESLRTSFFPASRAFVILPLASLIELTTDAHCSGGLAVISLSIFLVLVTSVGLSVSITSPTTSSPSRRETLNADVPSSGWLLTILITEFVCLFDGGLKKSTDIFPASFVHVTIPSSFTYLSRATRSRPSIDRIVPSCNIPPEPVGGIFSGSTTANVFFRRSSIVGSTIALKPSGRGPPILSPVGMILSISFPILPTILQSFRFTIIVNILLLIDLGCRQTPYQFYP